MPKAIPRKPDAHISPAKSVSFSKDDETVKIFAGYDVEEDGSIHFSERSVFPTSCVKKMIKLH